MNRAAVEKWMRSLAGEVVVRAQAPLLCYDVAIPRAPGEKLGLDLAPGLLLDRELDLVVLARTAPVPDVGPTVGATMPSGKL